jgi:hypothetical protein
MALVLHIVDQHGYKPLTPLFFANNGVSGFSWGGKTLTE